MKISAPISSTGLRGYTGAVAGNIGCQAAIIPEVTSEGMVPTAYERPIGAN